MNNKSIIFNFRSWMVFASAMTAASVFSVLLMKISSSDFHVPMIFVLAVLVISLYSDGYFYGVLASVLSVFAVNWAFTYPYMAFNFSLSGYLLTFVTMLAVGLATSLLSSRIKAQEKERMEALKEKMRANLLRSISHDLRTPLTSVSGSISAVLDENNSISDEQKRQLLCNAQDEAEWLCRMVDNLLSITKISGEKSEIKKSDELIEEVISEAVSTFCKRNENIDVSVELPPDPLFVKMDAMLIEQVLINLMDNAVIHGKNTSWIKINVIEEDKYVFVSVADNGGGIDSGVFKHLFDGSLQLSAGKSDKNKFMGIGLQVCKTVVEAHNGVIFAKNGEEGAIFTFKLMK